MLNADHFLVLVLFSISMFVFLILAVPIEIILKKTRIGKKILNKWEKM